MSRDILLSLIDPDPDQPRKHFDQGSLDELAATIAANGLAVPILVRPIGERFMIVHGERRFRAVTSLGWVAMPAEIRDIDPDQARWLALVENVQRADLSPIEEATAYQAALADGITQAALGEKIGKTQSYIAQKLRLLTLPEPVQTLIDQGRLTEGHGRQLLRLKGDDQTKVIMGQVAADEKQSVFVLKEKIDLYFELAEMEADIVRNFQDARKYAKEAGKALSHIKALLTDDLYSQWLASVRMPRNTADAFEKVDALSNDEFACAMISMFEARHGITFPQYD
jgi:ParB family chromosome partitioning protein